VNKPNLIGLQCSCLCLSTCFVIKHPEILHQLWVCKTNAVNLLKLRHVVTACHNVKTSWLSCTARHLRINLREKGPGFYINPAQLTAKLCIQDPAFNSKSSSEQTNGKMPPRLSLETQHKHFSSFWHFCTDWDNPYFTPIDWND